MSRTTVTKLAAEATAAKRAEGRNPLEAIRTASGRLFWPFAPREEEIFLEDIAHHLSHLCRFSGAVRTFYSVAQHSVLVSQICDKADALWGLLHDASEAYLSDVVRPLKHQPEFRGYLDREKDLQALICQRFGLASMMPDSVNKADQLALHAEMRDLMLSDPRHAAAAAGIRIITPHKPEIARHLFLERFYHLVGASAVRT
jgi:hypothetical protein